MNRKWSTVIGTIYVIVSCASCDFYKAKDADKKQQNSAEGRSKEAGQPPKGSDKAIVGYHPGMKSKAIDLITSNSLIISDSHDEGRFVVVDSVDITLFCKWIKEADSTGSVVRYCELNAKVSI